MTVRSAFLRILQQEDINFLVTNRIPRQLLTRFMGWFSKIEQPLVSRLSVAIWQMFADLGLNEAKKTRFSSLHDCFIRELKPGARPVDPNPAILVSPCDAIIGACGQLDGVQLVQAKGFPYTIQDLLGDADLSARYRNATYATLRITSTMYHRFHAPHDCRVSKVTYFSGDTWNVNPIALKRVERLFCKNERALIRTQLDSGKHEVLLVPVAAVLVASIQLHFLNVLLHLRYAGPNVISCDAHFNKGEEMGWFQHGSTILVFAPAGFALHEKVREGGLIRAGEPLMKLP
ncbi:MAG: archaetidylserine decarboxylase [Burkholderiales bacterium]